MGVVPVPRDPNGVGESCFLTKRNQVMPWFRSERFSSSAITTWFRSGSAQRDPCSVRFRVWDDIVHHSFWSEGGNLANLGASGTSLRGGSARKHRYSGVVPRWFRSGSEKRNRCLSLHTGIETMTQDSNGFVNRGSGKDPRAHTGIETNTTEHSRAGCGNK